VDYKDFFTTSCFGFGDLECDQEVGADGEGVLLLKWLFDLDFLAIHSPGHPSSTKMLNLEIRCDNMGDNHPVRDLNTIPYPFGLVALIGFVGPVIESLKRK